jgi:hypothetical protein
LVINGRIVSQVVEKLPDLATQHPLDTIIDLFFRLENHRLRDTLADGTLRSEYV